MSAVDRAFWLWLRQQPARTTARPAVNRELDRLARELAAAQARVRAA